MTGITSDALKSDSTATVDIPKASEVDEIFLEIKKEKNLSPNKMTANHWWT